MAKQSGLKSWFIGWYILLAGLTLVTLLVMTLASSESPAPTEQQVMLPPLPPPTEEQSKSRAGKQPTLGKTVTSYDQADFTYAFPTGMRVGQTRTLKAIVVPEGGQYGVDPISAVESEGDEARVVKIVVGSRVRVQLHGVGFTVDSLTSSEQVLLPGLASVWSWDVTPEKAGQQRLRLVVDTYLNTPEEISAAKTVFFDTATIEVNGHFWYSFGKAAVKYFGGLWEVLLGGLLIPVVLALIDRFRIEAKRRILPEDILKALDEERKKKVSES